MAELVLGPIVRHVGGGSATVWMETDRRCTVRVAGTEARTFAVAGRHYGLVTVEGLTPGEERPYTVELDGDRAWPPPAWPFPASVLRHPADERMTLAFGSCRVTAPHVPPFSLGRKQHPKGRGVDALRLLALRAARGGVRPDVLLMLGDQIYADEPSPRVHGDAEHLESFDDYARAYEDAWSDPPIRWLLSTVSTLMIFDDHEIQDEWRISEQWLREKRADAAYRRRLAAGLASYWLYQHLGNLPPAERDADETLAAIRASDDGAPLLETFAHRADHDVGATRWSFCHDVGPARLLVADSRAGRDLGQGRRRILGDDEWRWVRERIESSEATHLLFGTSVPVFLAGGLHEGEAAVQGLHERGGRWAAVADRLRRALHQCHWPAFGSSMEDLCRELEAVARRALGPASVVVVSGDVHHGYLARVRFGDGRHAPVWQAVCSPFRKELRRRERRVAKAGASRPGTALMRGLARLAGARPRPAAWGLVGRPSWSNQVALLELDGARATLSIHAAVGGWRAGHLRQGLRRRLA